MDALGATAFRLHESSPDPLKCHWNRTEMAFPAVPGNSTGLVLCNVHLRQITSPFRNQFRKRTKSMHVGCETDFCMVFASVNVVLDKFRRNVVSFAMLRPTRTKLSS